MSNVHEFEDETGDEAPKDPVRARMRQLEKELKAKEQAQGVFQRVGQLAGLYQEMGGEQALTEQQKVGAAFGFDVQAQQELERRRALRVGEFQAGGQFARTTGATSGTVETGVGAAQ